MQNGHDWKIAEKFTGLTISPPDPFRSSNHPTTAVAAATAATNQDSSLIQVMNAMEAAEATIKQQVEENIRLRTQLEHMILELHRYKLNESMAATQMTPGVVDPWAQHGSQDQAQQVSTQLENQIDRVANPSQTQSETLETQLGPSSGVNGEMKVVSSAISRLSSPPSTTSFSPGRSSIEGEYIGHARSNFSGNGLVSLTESNNPSSSSSLWKKDLVVKIHEHEHEIMQLRKHLADYSIKEAQIRSEKYVLEKRIAYMRLAFDQQQQDLVDAASKALSYRQDIIEENIRLAYAVQDAQQERTTFVSSLLPILAEYSLQPPVPDAQSIVGNVKVLFRHLQEKLLLTESKLKELQYQLMPWRSDSNQQQQQNVHITPPPSPPPQSIGGAALLNVNRNGLEMVSQNQPTYSPHGRRMPASASDAQITADWELMRAQHQSSGLGGGVTNTVEANELGLGMYSPVPNSSSTAQDVPVSYAAAQGDARVNRYGEQSTNKQVTFRDPVRNTHGDMDDQDAEGNQHDRETSSNWSAGNSPFQSPLNESSSPYHYLPPVVEEGSSFSEAADDDPLPAIEGLQISGEAFPGHELQASGYSINGTTSCNFEWVRHLQDGSVNYIEGAKQPTYLVTADDVDTYLAIEVQPLDDRKRKGELVKVFANDHKKITCDPEMQGQIEKVLYKGQTSFKVFQGTGYLDIWEPATLAIKRGAYSIKSSAGAPSGNGVVVAEKFSPNTMVTIPYGSPTDFIILSGSDSGSEYLLRADHESCSRDTIVLTLRLFIHKADERKNAKKGKIGSYFFNKYL